MRIKKSGLTFAATVLLASAAFAQQTPPADAPAGTTGLCKDGSYYSGATKSGACRGHKGVKDWYGPVTPAAAAAPAAPAAAAPAKAAPTAPVAAAPATPAASTAKAAPAAAAAGPVAAAPAAAPASATSAKPAVAAAPGGGPGLVWVNTSSKVYHCMGTEWYGKTKEGAYMSEADATAKGNRPDHGKSCGK